MKLKNYIKENLLTIRISIIVLILIGIIGTYTYSFFTVTQSNSNIIAGTAESLSLSVNVTKVAGTGKLIPQLDSAITSAITGKNGSCIDDNNNTVCHTYKITAKNNGSTVTSLNGIVTINKKNNPNLKWARYSPGTTPTLVGSVKETSNVELTTNEEFTAGQTKEYYIVVWISEIGHGQIDTGNYAGIVEFKTFDLVLPIEYEYYYSTLASAVNDINANTVGTNAISNKNSAVAGIYTLNDGTYSVVLLKDSVETTTVSPTVDMTINLGGHTFVGNARRVIDITTGNVIIDGRIPGSAVEVNYDYNDGNSTNIIVVTGDGGVTILGGTYKNLRSASNVLNSGISSQTTSYINIQDATIIATSPDYNTYGVNNQGGNLTISNCDINVISDNGTGIGVRNKSETVISNSRISSYGNYGESVDGQGFGYGIDSYDESKLTLNNCYVMGTGRAVRSKGDLYVSGGIYESFDQVLTLDNDEESDNNAKEVYISNATIRRCDLPDGYINFSEDIEYEGFIVRGYYVTVYMDNCNIYGNKHPFRLSGTNPKLYISNSTINLDSEGGIRIDNATNKLYIGAGNNFTINDVRTAPEGAINSVITTN